MCPDTQSGPIKMCPQWHEGALRKNKCTQVWAGVIYSWNPAGKKPILLKPLVKYSVPEREVYIPHNWHKSLRNADNGIFFALLFLLAF